MNNAQKAVLIAAGLAVAAVAGAAVGNEKTRMKLQAGLTGLRKERK